MESSTRVMHSLWDIGISNLYQSTTLVKVLLKYPLSHTYTSCRFWQPRTGFLSNKGIAGQESVIIKKKQSNISFIRGTKGKENLMANVEKIIL